MATKFNPVTPELLAELRQVVGDKYVKTDEDYLEKPMKKGTPIISINRKLSSSRALQKKLQLSLN